MSTIRNVVDDFARNGAAPSPAANAALQFQALDDFVAVDEPGADALLGDADNVLVPENGDVMVYGDGGAGKTTIVGDLAFHLAAGDDWCGIAVPSPVRVGLIENEGPRPLFRQKLRRRREHWKGSELGGRLYVLEHPWGQFTFADEEHRAWLAAAAAQLELDIIFLGPLTRLGMDAAGTLQETRDFARLLADVRERAGRRLALVLVHHENKGGQVSGAWEGAGDTLLHVQGLGQGRTRLIVQKARWASEWHGKAVNLTWAEGESFAVDGPDRDDSAIADAILAAVRANGGQSWNVTEKAVGGNNVRARQIRDKLLEGGRLLDANADRNVKAMVLWDSQDPLRPARLDADAPPDARGGEGSEAASASLRPRFNRTQERTDAPTPPADDYLDEIFSDLAERGTA